MKTDELTEKERTKEIYNSAASAAAASPYLVDNEVMRRLTKSTGLFVADVVAAAQHVRDMTRVEAISWINYMDEVDYRFSDGDRVNRRNFRRSLRMWHMMQKRIEAHENHCRENRFGKSVAADIQCVAERNAERILREKERFNKAFFRTERAWSLCAERCANCEGVGCAAGVQTPPAHRDEPYPPEDCPKFVERKEVA